jgi:hypothetical protein
MTYFNANEDLVPNSYPCLGCGRDCETPYNFCGRCSLAVHKAKKPAWKSALFVSCFLGLCWFGLLCVLYVRTK